MMFKKFVLLIGFHFPFQWCRNGNCEIVSSLMTTTTISAAKTTSPTTLTKINHRFNNTINRRTINHNIYNRGKIYSNIDRSGNSDSKDNKHTND